MNQLQAEKPLPTLVIYNFLEIHSLIFSNIFLIVIQLNNFNWTVYDEFIKQSLEVFSRLLRVVVELLNTLLDSIVYRMNFIMGGQWSSSSSDRLDLWVSLCKKCIVCNRIYFTAERKLENISLGGNLCIKKVMIISICLIWRFNSIVVIYCHLD